MNETLVLTNTASHTVRFTAPGFDFTKPFEYLYVTITGNAWEHFVERVEFWWGVYSIVAILISCVFFVGFVYARVRYEQLAEVEQEQLREAERKWAQKHGKTKTTNAKWEMIQNRVMENAPESWRVAIIEADILLDEVLAHAGYAGSLGEKLKSANPRSFTTLQDAWEAHKVRNEIAHVGSDFVLTQRSAKETILRYERVLREFGAI